ncbi:hypothetical protein Taro_039233 [Colocasia esculenta]|uniref:Peptidase M48 domain-containing protein n=1 Tax=Colocasia esculenta TaxID=4460 RepID=A0A843WG25_COLES|nr:hypothetical protein [Colocasia esculenta]
MLTTQSPSKCANEEEIVAVIAHELGHWKLNHTTYSFIAVHADAFGKKLGYATSLRAALVKLQVVEAASAGIL